MHSGGREQMKNDILDGKKAEPGTEEEGEGGVHTEIHNHGDGTFHTIHDGEKTEHGSIGEMHAHLSSIHGAPGEKHFHAHHDGMEAHSHAVESGGEAQHEEHDPENIESIKDHLGKFFNEEEQEGKGGEDCSEENGEGMLHSHALGM